MNKSVDEKLDLIISLLQRGRAAVNDVKKKEVNDVPPYPGELKNCRFSEKWNVWICRHTPLYKYEDKFYPISRHEWYHAYKEKEKKKGYIYM